MKLKYLKLFSSESFSLVTLGLGGGTVVITKSGDSTTITSGDSSAKVDITEISTADGVIFAIDTVLTGESTPWLTSDPHCTFTFYPFIIQINLKVEDHQLHQKVVVYQQCQE